MLVLLVFSVIFSIMSTIALNERIDSINLTLWKYEKEKKSMNSSINTLMYDYDKRMYAEQDPANTGNIQAYEME